MKRNSDSDFKFDYRIEVTRDMLLVQLFTPYVSEAPSKSFTFRQIQGKDYRFITGTAEHNAPFSTGYIYPFDSIKKLCDGWLEGVAG